jgi:hypothetical protein
MCDDHPNDPQPFGRRWFLGRAAIAPLAVPAALALGAQPRPAQAAQSTIRSKACSVAGDASIPVSTPLVELMAKHGVTKLHPRSDWAGKLVAKGPLQAETPRFLLVHHTVSSNTYAETAVADQIRGFFNFHTGAEKKWPDVAYNFFIDRFGGVWEARAGSLAGPVRGDATGGNQGFSQLVCMIGDYGALAPSPAAVDSLARVLAALGEKYGIDTAPGATTSFISRKSNRWKAGVCVETPTIAGHREMSQTSCPGDALFAIVRDELPGRVARVRRA